MTHNQFFFFSIPLKYKSVIPLLSKLIQLNFILFKKMHSILNYITLNCLFIISNRISLFVQIQYPLFLCCPINRNCRMIIFTHSFQRPNECQSPNSIDFCLQFYSILLNPAGEFILYKVSSHNNEYHEFVPLI